jgi:hypothetical protein
MAPSRAAFRRRFLASSPGERLDFLADLYEAQGWQVQRLEDALEIRQSAAGPARTVRLVDDSALDETDADVAVLSTKATNAGDVDGVSVVDPSELYDRLRYGVQSGASTRLLEAHFGEFPAAAPPESGEMATGSSSSDAPFSDDESDETDAGDRRPDRTRRALLLATGAVLGAGGTLATTRFVDGRSPVRVPGITREGVEQADTLAASHMSALRTRSYSFGLDHVRRDDHLSIRSSYGIDLSLSAERDYLARVSTDGPEAPRTLGDPPARSAYYSDGQQHFVDRSPDEDGGVIEFEPPNGYMGTWEYWAYIFAFGGMLGSTPERYFQHVFEAIPTRLVDVREDGDGGLYRLESTERTLRASPQSFTGRDVRDLDMSAVVDERGLVRGLTLEYRSTVDGTPSRVSRRIKYDNVGETDVESPDWVP